MPERKPTRTADLDYFYGQSSELFSFYRIPKLLFQDSRFQPLSTDAKTLYGILLDRMSLSARNGWLDKAGRVFIIYTVQEVQDSLGCADKKATKLLRELEEYGLIERKRRGLGKPDLIYVKNFSSESSKLRFLNRDNDDSGTVQNTLQDPAKLRCNKNKRNNTEMSDTDPIYSDENDWMSEREQQEEYFSQSLPHVETFSFPADQLVHIGTLAYNPYHIAFYKRFMRVGSMQGLPSPLHTGNQAVILLAYPCFLQGLV